jgi:hypothetical protein
MGGRRRKSLSAPLSSGGVVGYIREFPSRRCSASERWIELVATENGGGLVLVLLSCETLKLSHADEKLPSISFTLALCFFPAIMKVLFSVANPARFIFGGRLS